MRWSAVAPNPSRYRIADNRLPEDPRQKFREVVSDRDSGVRGWGERPPARAPEVKGTVIMKLTTMTQVTVDGVVQGNGGASDEDRANGFERGGWALGAGDDQTRALITQAYQRAGAFLFGRRTYELVVPVVFGQGSRLFPGTGRDIALDLTGSRADTKGVTSRSTGQPGARSTQPAETRDIAGPEPHSYY